MYRTQNDLSSEERQGLQALARQEGRSQSDLIREGIPSLAVLREELDRVLPAGEAPDQRP